MRALIFIAALILSGCAKRDYGQCLASHVKAPWTSLQPMIVGKVMILIPMRHAAQTICDRWQYPDGRPAA